MGLIFSSTFEMYTNDPFFLAQQKRSGPPWGQHRSYMEDVYRTYGKLPHRSSATYEKALAFRMKELERHRATEAERDSYMDLSARMEEERQILHSKLAKQERQYSKLKSKYERSINDRDTRNGSSSLQTPLANNADGPRKDESAAVPVEALQPNAPDPGGHGAQHGDEGRHTRGGELEGGPEVHPVEVHE